MSEEIKKKKRFRSFKFNPTSEEIKQIESMSGRGIPMQNIADYFSISKDCLETARDRLPELKTAILKGRTIAIDNVTAVAYNMAKSGTCPAMTIFWLKCRARWSDQHTIKITQEFQDENGETKESDNKYPALILDLSGKYSANEG